MTCLAGLGAELSGFKASAEGADKNLVLDGCAVACGAKIFDKQLIDLITDKVLEASK